MVDCGDALPNFDVQAAVGQASAQQAFGAPLIDLPNRLRKHNLSKCSLIFVFVTSLLHNFPIAPSGLASSMRNPRIS